MALGYREPDYDDYLIAIGDRVRFKTRYGDVIEGTVTGMGAAGNYVEIEGDDGRSYSGYTSDPDLRKVF